MKIVITGNMGCGKSTAVQVILRELNQRGGEPYVLFDFDKCVASLYQDEVVQMQLDHAFGTHEKSQVSDIVHRDPEAMIKLRDITDGAMLTAIHKANNQVNVIFDIPLYYEFNDHMRLTPDIVICVAADFEDQIERVKARNGFSEEKIRAILAKQLPQEEKVARSDFVLHNAWSSKEEFETHVETFVRQHLEWRA